MIYQILKKKNKHVHIFWKLDETYTNVKGKRRYLYRTIDKKKGTHWIFNFVKGEIIRLLMLL
ncbi:hypothetical protein COF09_30520 [Bacillus toyonensis]|nr:hypothetical protein COF09_30520 [Bacillus toyonensis]